MSSQWQNHDKPKLFFNILNKKPMIILRVNKKKKKEEKVWREKKLWHNLIEYNLMEYNLMEHNLMEHT